MILDLSRRLTDNTPAYPGDPPFRLVKREGTTGYISYEISGCLHSGTHVDLPMHLLYGDTTCADFPLDRLFGDGQVLDVRGKSVITAADFDLKPEHIPLLFTGWDKTFGKPEYFVAHPVLDMSTAEKLVSSGLKLIGLDFPSPDALPFTVHKYLLEHDICIVENLTGLEQLHEPFKFSAFPLALEAEASIVRAVAIL
jgi:kynurenine formamidase